MEDGSRPAKSQPTIAANAGMPRRIRRRSATGAFPSAAIPPFSELLRSQPIMPMSPQRSEERAEKAERAGRHRHVPVLLERAQQVGSDVVFVTDSVSLSSEWQIPVRLLSGRGRQGMFASHATTVVLIEALALSMAANQPAQARASVELLNVLRGTIAGRPLAVDP